MRPIGPVARSTAILLPTLLIWATGCGSDPKPEAKTPAAATAQAAPKKGDDTMPPAPNSPTASAITIDDAILKACGIEAPKAHFAFDSANVQNQDTATLERVAKCFT